MQNFEISQRIKELRERISELRDEEEILQVKLQNRLSELDKIKDKRDELNAKVKELSQKPKEILEKRKGVWDDISETNEEKRKMFKEMQPFLQRIGELRKVRDSYNAASKGTLDYLVEQYNAVKNDLLSSDLSLKNELFMYQLLFELRDRMLVKKEADSVHQAIVRIKEVDLAKYNKVLEEMEGRIDGMKNVSHESLLAAKELWGKRDSTRDEAQRHHHDYIEGLKGLKDLKKQIYDKKGQIVALYREIDDWKKEFDKSPSERRQSDNTRKLKEVLEKYKNGDKLSLEELSLLVESGQMK